MKKMVIWVMVFIVLTGCHQGASQFQGEGYILEVTDQHILVIEKEFPGKSWKDMMDEYTGDAIWLGTKKKGLKPGQKIQYQVKGGIDESYPAQAEAKNIKIIKEGKE
ncbi:YobA family protein [Paenibacillus sp. GM2]|uniref:YobA family protein n=1 Tax=Paenibacillus sp. GM2 TaxID=1622070 RepID=UPI000837EC33|nr:YobA family protein [Paenibacillus sp. GM2]